MLYLHENRFLTADGDVLSEVLLDGICSQLDKAGELAC